MDDFLGQTSGSARQGFSPKNFNGSTTAFSSLTAGRSLDKIHHYPLFLQSSAKNQDEHEFEQAREVIQFTAVKQPGISFNKDFEEKFRQREQDSLNANVAARRLSDSGDFNFGLGKFISDIGDLPSQATESFKSATIGQGRASTGDRTIDDRDNGDKADSSLFGRAINAGKQQLNAKVQLLEDCFLYMPSSVVFNEGAVWQKEALGASGNAIGSMLKSEKSIGNILKEFAAGMAVPLGRAGAIAASAFAAGKIGGLLTVLGGQGVENALFKTTRLAQNPYEEQLFSGVDFRSFTFDFEFNAVSTKEFDAVKDIITMFRSHSRPTFAIEGGSQALYSYPNEFAIKFLHLDMGEGSRNSGQYIENTNLPRLHNCVLTNITTDYTPDGWQAHSDGEPNLITMQLQFTETLKNTRIDIEEGKF